MAVPHGNVHQSGRDVARAFSTLPSWPFSTGSDAPSGYAALLPASRLVDSDRGTLPATADRVPYWGSGGATWRPRCAHLAADQHDKAQPPGRTDVHERRGWPGNEVRVGEEGPVLGRRRPPAPAVGAHGRAAPGPRRDRASARWRPHPPSLPCRPATAQRANAPASVSTRRARTRFPWVLRGSVDGIWGDAGHGGRPPPRPLSRTKRGPLAPQGPLRRPALSRRMRLGRVRPRRRTPSLPRMRNSPRTRTRRARRSGRKRTSAGGTRTLGRKRRTRTANASYQTPPRLPGHSARMSTRARRRRAAKKRDLRTPGGQDLRSQTSQVRRPAPGPARSWQAWPQTPPFRQRRRRRSGKRLSSCCRPAVCQRSHRRLPRVHGLRPARPSPSPPRHRRGRAAAPAEPTSAPARARGGAPLRLPAPGLVAATVSCET